MSPDTELQNGFKARQQFQQQQHENEMVMKELELMDEDESVYKLIGPALLKQDKDEATSNVRKRLEFIGGELRRIGKRLEEANEMATSKRMHIMKLQEEAQRLQQAAAASQ